MTKTIKTIIIATVLTCAIMISCACAMPACAEAKTYEVDAVVTEMRIAFPGCWEVIATDERGEQWGWFADNADGEYWHIGDLVRLTMLDLSGEHEEEDEVMDVILLGELTPVGVADWLNWD